MNMCTVASEIKIFAEIDVWMLNRKMNFILVLWRETFIKVLTLALFTSYCESSLSNWYFSTGTKSFVPISVSMMTSSNIDIYRVTGHLCEEFTGPRKKASDAELWCFLWSVPEWTIEKTIVRLVIWDAIAPIMTSPSHLRIGCLYVVIYINVASIFKGAVVVICTFLSQYGCQGDMSHSDMTHWNDEWAPAF